MNPLEQIVKNAKLTKRQAEVWCLCADKRLTHKQIAEKLGTSRQNISKVLGKALGKILEEIEKNPPQKVASMSTNKDDKADEIFVDVWNTDGKLKHGFSLESERQWGGDGKVSGHTETGKPLYNFVSDLPKEADFTSEQRKNIHRFIVGQVRQTRIGKQPDRIGIQHWLELYQELWFVYLEAERDREENVKQKISAAKQTWCNKAFRQFTKDLGKRHKIPKKYHAPPPKGRSKLGEAGSDED